MNIRLELCINKQIIVGQEPLCSKTHWWLNVDKWFTEGQAFFFLFSSENIWCLLNWLISEKSRWLWFILGQSNCCIGCFFPPSNLSFRVDTESSHWYSFPSREVEFPRHDSDPGIRKSYVRSLDNLVWHSSRTISYVPDVEKEDYRGFSRKFMVILYHARVTRQISSTAVTGIK